MHNSPYFPASVTRILVRLGTVASRFPQVNSAHYTMATWLVLKRYSKIIHTPIYLLKWDQMSVLALKMPFRLLHPQNFQIQEMSRNLFNGLACCQTVGSRFRWALWKPDVAWVSLTCLAFKLDGPSRHPKTAPLCSPEQILHASLDQSVHIWSFFCLAYKHITGKKMIPSLSMGSNDKINHTHLLDMIYRLSP